MIHHGNQRPSNPSSFVSIGGPLQRRITGVHNAMRDAELATVLAHIWVPPGGEPLTIETLSNFALALPEPTRFHTIAVREFEGATEVEMTLTLSNGARREVFELWIHHEDQFWLAPESLLSILE